MKLAKIYKGQRVFLMIEDKSLSPKSSSMIPTILLLEESTQMATSF